MLKIPRKVLNEIRESLQGVYLWDTTVSVYHVLKILWAKVLTFDIDQRAASVAYSFLLAVFPGIIFLFTLIPYIPIVHLDWQILAFMKDVMPRSLYQTTFDTVKEIVSHKRSDILSFGFLFAVYAATNGVMALMKAFNMALKVKDKRTFLEERGIAFMLTFLLLILMISAIVVLLVGNIIIDIMLDRGIIGVNSTYYLLQIIRYSVIFTIFFIGICLIYYFGPAVTKRLKFFNFGAFVAAFLSIITTNLFSLYISNFNSYNKLYGSIGTLIALMVWLYLIVLILILGFEVNLSIQDALAEQPTTSNNSTQKVPLKKRFLKP